jgi:hypothetical protein
MRFSNTTKCFYPKNIDYPSLPGDLIDVALEDYNIALARSPDERLDIVAGKVVVVPTTLSSDELSAIHRENIGKAIVAGIDFNGLHYPTAITDQLNMAGLILESMLPGSGDEYKFWCKDSQGVWIRKIHTKAEIQAVGLAISAHVKAQQELNV